MKDTTPSPTPEEIEAAARALFDYPEPGTHPTWEDEDPGIIQSYREQAEAALKAAMAVRRGTQVVTSFPGFKEGQIVTGKGIKPGIVTISKDGTVVIVPKDE